MILTNGAGFTGTWGIRPCTVNFSCMALIRPGEKKASPDAISLEISPKKLKIFEEVKEDFTQWAYVSTPWGAVNSKTL